MVNCGIVCVVGNEALTVTVPDTVATAMNCMRFPRGSLRLILLSYQEFNPCRQTGGPRAYSSLVMRVAQGVTTPSTAHDAFPSVARVGKGGESHRLILLSCIQISLPSSFVLELSASFQIPSTTRGNDIHPHRLSLLVRERPQEAKAAARLAVVGVRWEDTVRSHSARRFVVR
jgi:hypothetical protein